MMITVEISRQIVKRNDESKNNKSKKKFNSASLKKICN